MDRSRILRPAVTFAILATYVAVRFWNLTASCLWFDEIFSVHAAEHSWDSILNFVSLDLIHPPLFYVLLKAWIAIDNESLLWLRSFPVIWSIIAIFPFLMFCRELRVNSWTTVFAFFLIAVNGSMIKYAQEVRMYSMLMCISLSSMWLFARYFEKGKGIVALTLVNILLVYTHYFGWLVILSEIVAVLIFQRIKWRAVLLMTTATFLSFVPWLLAVVSAARSGSELGQNIGWMQRPGLVNIGQLVFGLIEPFYYQSISIEPMSVYRISIPLLGIAAGSVTCYFAKARRITRDERTSTNLLLIFSFFPIVIGFLASWLLPYSIWGTRHLIIVFAPTMVLFADAIVHLNSLKLRAVVLTLVLLFVGYAVVVQVQHRTVEPIWCGLEPLAREALAEHPAPIVVFEDLTAYHLWFAFRSEKDPPRLIKVQDFSGATEDTAYFLPRGFDGVSRVAPEDLTPKELWVVYRLNERDIGPLDNFVSQGYEIDDKKTVDFGYQKLIGAFVRKKR